MIRQEYPTLDGAATNLGPRNRLALRFGSCPVMNGSWGRADRVSPSVFHSSYYRRPDRPVDVEVVTMHDMIPELFGGGVGARLQCALKRRALERADGVICVSHATRADLLSIYPWVAEKNVHVVHNGVSAVRETDMNGCSEDEDRTNRVLFVGERRGYKNFAPAIDAVSREQHLELALVGGGPLSRSERLKLDRTLGGRYAHKKRVTAAELRELYRSAFCLLYPSSYEGFGLPPLEAMAAGCPVVATHTPAVTEVVGDAALLAPAAEADALWECLAALRSREWRARMVAEGRRRAESFSWEQCVAHAAETYWSIISRS